MLKKKNLFVRHSRASNAITDSAPRDRKTVNTPVLIGNVPTDDEMIIYRTVSYRRRYDFDQLHDYQRADKLHNIPECRLKKRDDIAAGRKAAELRKGGNRGRRD